MPMTSFDPQTDGFAFGNYWTIDESESDLYGEKLKDAISGALSTLNPLIRNTMILSGLSVTLNAMALNAVPQSYQTYGLCGGMAFAALDYFAAHLPIPGGKVPPSVSGAGRELRDYLQQRQLDSLQANLPAVLTWMAALHLVPQGWGLNGGASWLLAQTKLQWQMLMGQIDVGQLVPLSLIGTTRNPMENHQVLACGYDAPDPALGANDTGVIHVYDMNCPGEGQTIRLDLRGSILSAVESCPNDERGPLRGFICEKYVPPANKPPEVMDWNLSPTVQV